MKQLLTLLISLLLPFQLLAQQVAEPDEKADLIEQSQDVHIKLKELQKSTQEVQVRVVRIHEDSLKPERRLRKLVNEQGKLGFNILMVDLSGNGTDLISANQCAQAIKDFKGLSIAWISENTSGSTLLTALACDFVFISETARIHTAPPFLKAVNGDLKELELPEQRQLMKIAEKFFRRAANNTERDIDFAQALINPKHPITLFDKIYNQDGIELDLAARDLLQKHQGENLLVQNLADTEREILNHLSIKKRDIIHESPSSSERLARKLLPFLPLLWLLLSLGLIIEFNTPGFGIGGSVAIIGIGVALFFQYQLGLTDIWNVLLIAVGIGLIAVEVFVLPGFGIAGISGGLMLFAGVLLSFIDLQGFSEVEFLRDLQVSNSVAFALKNMIIIAVQTMCVAGLMIWLLPKTAFYKKTVMMQPIANGPGAAPRINLVQGTIPESALLFACGNAVTDLRPVGRAEFQGTGLDVVTHGELIDKGTAIRIIEIEGNRVVVESEQVEES